jgi:hypothetical protein
LAAINGSDRAETHRHLHHGELALALELGPLRGVGVEGVGRDGPRRAEGSTPGDVHAGGKRDEPSQT